MITCVIECDSNEYDIAINNGFNRVMFDNVLKAIRQQIRGQQNVSFDSHTFEIYDSDSNAYFVVNSAENIIKNLSRIRCSPKHNVIKNDLSRAMDYNSSPETTKANAELNRSPKSLTSSLSSSASQRSPKKCRNVLMQSITNENRDTYLTQLTAKHENQFIETHNNRNAWQLVLNDMISAGFSVDTTDKCANLFNSLVQRYVRVLNNSLTYQKKCLNFYLFEKLNEMNLKPFMNANAYEKLVKSKSRIKYSDHTFSSRHNKQKEKQSRNVNNKPKNSYLENRGNHNGIERTEPKLKIISYQHKNDKFNQNIKVDNSKLLINTKRMSYISSETLNRDRKLLHSVNNFSDLFLIDESNAWQSVANEINRIHLGLSLTGDECQTLLNDIIVCFVSVLNEHFNYHEARAYYPLFEQLFKMNLQHFMPPNKFQHLKVLKKKFNIKPYKISPEKQRFKNSITQNNVASEETNNRQRTPNQSFVTNKGNHQFRNTSGIRNPVFKPYKEFFEMIITESISNTVLINDLLNASDVDEQLKIFLSRTLLNESDYSKRVSLKNFFTQILAENGIVCELHFFGSTANSLGFRDTDIDFYLEIKDEKLTNKINFEEAMTLLNEIKKILKNHLRFFIPKPFACTRCPIVRVDFKCLNNNLMGDKLRSNGITCDLNVSNALGVHNSKLIRLFCDLEPCFQRLTAVLRYWAKLNEFVGRNGMSSYAFTMLVVFFCQSLTPPLLPAVDYLTKLAPQSLVIDGWECGFVDDLSLIERSQNTQTVYELVALFFQFYSTFEFTTQVICPKSAQAVHKSTFMSQKHIRVSQSGEDLSFKITSFCCIQDPFNLEHNLTANVRLVTLNRFFEHIKHIADKFDLIFAGNRNDIRDQYWGLSRMFTKFDPTDGFVENARIHVTPSFDLIKNHLITTRQIMKIMANNYSALMLNVMKNIYKINCQLIEKWDIVVDQISPFAKFVASFSFLNFQIISQKIRDITLKTDFKDRKFDSDLEREMAISDQIVANSRSKHSSKLDTFKVRFEFVLVMNARTVCPIVDFELIDNDSRHQHNKIMDALISRIFNTFKCL